MRPSVPLPAAIVLLPVILFLSACSTPSLVEIARRRQATATDVARGRVKDDVRVEYSITDWDVLNFTNEVQRKLANRAHIHAGLRYGSTTGEVTLSTLAGAAAVAGWGATTASGLGTGASYLFSLGRIFDAKGQSQAYETAFTAIEKAETTYYFHQLGFVATRDSDGHYLVASDPGRNPSTYSTDGKNIPFRDRLTIDGETLYYRVIKTLKVLDDALEQKIPNLEDLQDSVGGSASAPHLDPGAPAPSTPRESSGSTHRVTPPKENSPETAENSAPAHAGEHATPPVSATEIVSDEPEKALQRFGWPGGVKNEQNLARLKHWMDDNDLREVDFATLIHSAQYSRQRVTAVASLQLGSHHYLRDPAGIALQQYCWPEGKKNDQNFSALQKWITENVTGSVDVVTFINSDDEALQRKSAIAAMRLSDVYADDAWGAKLLKFCWPSKKTNMANIAKLRAWMNANALTDVDPATFIHSQQYAAQRRQAVEFFHL